MTLDKYRKLSDQVSWVTAAKEMASEAASYAERILFSSSSEASNELTQAQWRAHFASEYKKVQRQLEEEIDTALGVGSRELAAANSASVGWILAVVYNIQEHLADHLTTVTTYRMSVFEDAVKRHLDEALSRMRDQMLLHDAKDALSSLRNLDHLLCRVTGENDLTYLICVFVLPRIWMYLEVIHRVSSLAFERMHQRNQAIRAERNQPEKQNRKSTKNRRERIRQRSIYLYTYIYIYIYLYIYIYCAERHERRGKANKKRAQEMLNEWNRQRKARKTGSV